MDSMGREDLFAEIEQLDLKLYNLYEFLTHWMGYGQLQTFESREQFRKEASKLLNEITGE